MITSVFKQLNHGWNAEPNAPSPSIMQQSSDVLLRFLLNPWKFNAFSEEEEGILRFSTVSKYRLGATNDEGWYKGQCRYSKLAPSWGEFYEIVGDDPARDAPKDWKVLSAPLEDERHFLFYLRDDTFEAIARDWAFADLPENALLRLNEDKRKS
ncbi:MAG TPA: hypothetical protein VMF58_02970 [Rhizomicrobium sp.]|nr:hypothetical protein [Rhizomicrobium sp.]